MSKKIENPDSFISESLPTELETLADWVRYAVSRFEAAEVYFGHGSDNAVDEAYYLVTQSLHLAYDIPSYMMHAKLTGEEKALLFHLIRRRVNERIPVPYLTHKAWFAGLEFYIDERVLIPRSPIAELIEAGFQPWLQVDEVESILDLCTGSGCIAIACAMAFPEAVVTACDIDNDVLELAAENVKAHEMELRVNLCQSDVFDNLDKEMKFDLIVSNPPYVDDEDMQSLPAEYRHEPGLALAAGENGLQVIDKILSEAYARLNDNGMLVVEVGNSADALLDAYPDVEFTWFEFERSETPVFFLYKEQLKTLYENRSDNGATVVH